MPCAVIRGSSTSPTTPASGPTRCATSTSRGKRSHSLDADFDDKLDLITVVDEYVFGYCLHERNNLKDDPDDSEMVDYFGSAAESRTSTRRCPRWCAEMGLPRLWSRIHNHARSAGRFDRNLARLLAGFEASLPR